MLKLKYVYFAIALYLVVAIFSIGHNSPDEYYQILEFASYKLGLGDKKFLTWEYFDQIRPAIQIWYTVYIYKIFAIFTQEPNPFMVALVLRLTSVIISLLAVFAFIQAFLSSIKYTASKKWFILLSLFTWLIVYNSTRYSSENISEKLFLLGFAGIFIPKINQSFIANLIIGILLGLSFDIRFQTGFLIFALYLWLVFINNFNVINGNNQKVTDITRLMCITLGIIIAIAIGVLIDRWFYEVWVFTPWNYLYMNIFQGKAASFGHETWYFYLAVAGLLPYGPLYIISTYFAIIHKFKNPVIWLMIIYVVAHSFVSHKELRFLIPILCFMPLIIAYSFDIYLSKNITINKKVLKLSKLCWQFNLVLVLLVALLPSGTNAYLCKVIYNKFNSPMKFYAITEGGNELNFYKRKNVELYYIKNVNQIQCEKNKICLLALTCQQVQQYTIYQKYPIIYDNCPNWLLKLNFNGWLDRSAVYRIYQLH